MTHPYRHLLMVYPAFPKTYWGMEYSLPLVGRKAAMVPLGLITIAGLTPPGYEIRLVDLNCEPLTDRDLKWADMVCFSAMLPQKRSLLKVARRCQEAGKLVVFGGPYPTSCPEECGPYCDVMVLNEGEITWPLFLEDLARGTYQRVYTTQEKPDVAQSPVPRFDLLNIHDYINIPIQFSRGCPFQCEFCDIIVLFGRTPRTKTPGQVLAELEAVYNTGYRGGIFIVDDNFIGNKREVKKLLPEIKAWNETYGHPFHYGTQASVDLANDKELLQQMVESDFLWVFMGIESPSPESLKETRKYQNVKKGSLVDSVKEVQSVGLVVYGGFIVGFDNDTEDIFDRQIELITQAAIPSASLSVLCALPGTPLMERMKRAGRLLDLSDPDSSHDINWVGYDTNIVTVLPRRKLLEGYCKILETIYTPREYFQRTLEAFCRLPRRGSLSSRIQKVFWLSGLALKKLIIRDKQKQTSGPSTPTRWKSVYETFRRIPADYKWESLKFIWAIMRKRPDQLFFGLVYVFMGIHFYRFTFADLIPDIDRRLERLPQESTEQGERLAAEPVFLGLSVEPVADTTQAA
ncbi:MAG: DUF4070 domain-containing protein [Acidobacteria bacterium]|nr:DUF4070 domain-containing protein [Acidobacteriota bacterium]